jgi:group I intron endonuclease
MNIFIDTFPVLVAFENLDLIENVKIAKNVLNGHSGIYAFVHIETGASYIGSSIDLGGSGRIMEHINNSTNPHLHKAILKYGLSHYAFVILEYCFSSDLLIREQHFLDLLNTLPKELIYNLLQIAFIRLQTYGCEARRSSRGWNPQQPSELKLGDNNPIHGRTGENHPMSRSTPY